LERWWTLAACHHHPGYSSEDRKHELYMTTLLLDTVEDFAFIESLRGGSNRLRTG
jgi:hypothetical protein